MSPVVNLETESYQVLPNWKHCFLNPEVQGFSCHLIVAVTYVYHKPLFRGDNEGVGTVHKVNLPATIFFRYGVVFVR